MFLVIIYLPWGALHRTSNGAGDDRRDYMAWNKDTVDDRKISDDLTELSDGKLQMTDSIVRLMAERIDQNYRPKVNNQNNRNNNRNNKRKY